MTILKLLAIALLGLSTLLLGSCATPMPEGSPIIKAQANHLEPPKGWCGIYVFRPGLPTSDALWRVNLDYKQFGYLATQSYLYGAVRPGEHMMDLAYDGSQQSFHLNAGENAYYKIVLGFPGAKLSPISAAEAKELLKTYRLSILNQFENDKAREVFREHLENR